MDLGSSNTNSFNNLFPLMISLAIVIIGLMVFFAIVKFDLLPRKKQNHG